VELVQESSGQPSLIKEGVKATIKYYIQHYCGGIMRLSYSASKQQALTHCNADYPSFFRKEDTED
jgi:hypothetical protein